MLSSNQVLVKNCAFSKCTISLTVNQPKLPMFKKAEATLEKEKEKNSSFSLTGAVGKVFKRGKSSEPEEEAAPSAEKMWRGDSNKSDARKVADFVNMVSGNTRQVYLQATHVDNAKDGQKARYICENQIGEGGTAKVYKAYDSYIRRYVALKRFHNNETDASDYFSEVESASLIHHPNVITIFDVGVDDYGFFLVMELIDGMDMEKTLANRAMVYDQFREMASQLLEGLVATHKEGILHLDIKPSNIMVVWHDSGKMHFQLIDFGRAKHSDEEFFVSEDPKTRGLNGSIHYMSPEQLNNKALDERSDIYALGCVFYYALTGRRPFGGDNSIQVMASHLQGRVEPLEDLRHDLPRWLTSMVMKMIALNPYSRQLNAKAILAEFHEGDQEEMGRRYKKKVDPVQIDPRRPSEMIRDLDLSEDGLIG